MTERLHDRSAPIQASGTASSDTHTWRSVFILTATAIGFGFSFVMLQQFVGSASPWLGFILMFYFLGLAKTAEPLFMLRLPGKIRDVRSWENDGVVYRYLAVSTFGRLLRETPLRYLNPTVYLVDGKPDLLKIYRQVASAEAIHFWAAVLFTPYIGFVWLTGHKREAMIFLLIQLLFNVYPVLHLRTVRGRMEGPLCKWLARHARTQASRDATA
jgi:hypothetical protein